MLNIGFDAKRAACNRTGLGNYSRFVVRGLSRYTQARQLLLYVPRRRRIEALDGLDGERGVQLRWPTRGLWPLLPNLWRQWGITRDVELDGVELFHGLSGELPRGIEAARDVRSVVTIHDLIFMRYPHLYKLIDRHIYEAKFRHACRVADRIVAVSECTRRDVVTLLGVPEQKVEVIYQGCDESFRRKATADQRADVRRRWRLPGRYILYVGSIEERKNLFLLAEALPLLRDKEVEVVAVGRRTDYAERVEEWVAEKGFAHRFHILHGVPHADLPVMYQEALAFVYPSRFEGFGIPMLEALCSGTPAIGCTGSSLEEAGGQDSAYVSPDNAPALADMLDNILADNFLREIMIERGHQYAERFRMDTLAREMMDLYCRVEGLKA